jgi:hypothetical protein
VHGVSVVVKPMVSPMPHGAVATLGAFVEGAADGKVGASEGAKVGSIEGLPVVGVPVGAFVGAMVGIALVGETVGKPVVG